MKVNILISLLLASTYAINLRGYPYNDDPAADSDDVTLSMVDLDNLEKEEGGLQSKKSDDDQVTLEIGSSTTATANEQDGANN